MERTAVLKIAVAALAFCGIFVGLTALGLYFLDTALTDEEGESPPTDYPEVEKNDDSPAEPRPPGPSSSTKAPAYADVAEQIELLGSSDYRVRVEAETRLVGMGNRAVPLLEQAMRHRDPEVRWRAKEALRRIREGR